MSKQISLKPNLSEVSERFHKWWNFEPMDRPVLEIPLNPQRQVFAPKSNHASLRDRWLDVEYQVDNAMANIRARDYLAETLPVYMPDIGPDLTSTLWGESIDFGEDTSWALHRVKDEDGWGRILEIEPDFENPYLQALDKMTALALEKAGDDILVGLYDWHGSLDTMVSLRGPEELCMDLMDDVELMVEVANRISDVFNQALRRNYEMLKAVGQGSTTWAKFYHEGFAYIPSCDFWCLISPEMAKNHIVQTIVTETLALDNSIFHLDGPDALRHIDWLLDFKELSAVQWVYGAGQGTSLDWIDTYKKILDAGKSIQVYAYTPDEALELVSKLGTRGVWITLYQALDTREEGEAYLRKMENICS